MSLLNDQALWHGKFFNGQWQAASQSREAVEVATGQVLGAIGYADGRDIAASAQAAKAAQRDWWRRPYQERQAVMERAADQLAVRDPNGRIVTCFSVSSRKEEEFATQT